MSSAALLTTLESLANKNMSQTLISPLKSLINPEKCVGPKEDPCITPDVTLASADVAPLYKTRSFLLRRRSLIQRIGWSDSPSRRNLAKSTESETLSNARAKSSNTTSREA